MEDKFENPDAYDLFVEIKGGHVDGVKRARDDSEDDEEGSDDLRNKIKVISRNETFAGLDVRNQRLLAFAAQWYTAKPGQRIFSMEDKPDAAYLCVTGQAVLSYSSDEGENVPVTTVEPGRLIGDLAVILNEPRQLHLEAVTEVTFLRIGAREFKSVIENDTGVLMKLLETVASHLSGAAELLRQSDNRIPQDVGPPTLPPE